MAHTHLKMQLERLWLDWPTIAVLTAFVVIGIADIANPGMFDDAVTVATGGGFLFAGVRLLRYGRKDSHPDRRGFGLIGVTLLLGALGMVLFGVVSQFAPLPAFGPLDGVFHRHVSDCIDRPGVDAIGHPRVAVPGPHHREQDSPAPYRSVS